MKKMIDDPGNLKTPEGKSMWTLTKTILGNFWPKLKMLEIQINKMTANWKKNTYFKDLLDSRRFWRESWKLLEIGMGWKLPFQPDPSNFFSKFHFWTASLIILTPLSPLTTFLRAPRGVLGILNHNIIPPFFVMAAIQAHFWKTKPKSRKPGQATARLSPECSNAAGRTNRFTSGLFIKF